MLRYVLLMAIFLPGCLIATGQTKNHDGKVHSSGSGILKPLLIGAKVPEISFDTVYNTGRGRTTISEMLKKGPLVVCFWRVQCGSCIRLLSSLQSAQSQSDHPVQVLTVSDEPYDSVARFFNKQRELTGDEFGLPLVSRCPELQQLFPYKAAPYYAWIRQDGKLAYLTDSKAITGVNLNAFSLGESLRIPPEEDELRFNPFKPLFIKDYGGDGSSMLWYSVLSKYIKGMPWVSGIATDSTRTVGLIYNAPVKAMYQAAFNDFPDNSFWVPDNRTILEVADSDNLVYKRDGLYQTSNYWCYYLVAPKMPTDSIKIMMQHDMDKYFKLTGRMEKRKMLCWVLHAGDTNIIKASGGERKNYHDIARFKLILQNVKMSTLLERFIYHLLEGSPYPFVNEIAYSGNISIVMDDIVYNNPVTIQQALKKYKMELILEERKINMLVIRNR